MSVKDSIENVSNELSGRTTNRRGKLIKGSTKNGTIPTIPTKYFTVINDNSDKKGFLQSSKRFQYDQNDLPGPGAYVNPKNLDDALKRTSDSKKGTGSFASSSKRDFINNLNKVPGAGAYNVSENTIGKRNDFSVGFSRQFKRPIANETETHLKENNPAPNSYDVEKSSKYKFKANNVCATAAFKSQSKRESSAHARLLSQPAPGSYDVNDEHVHQSVKVPFSSFKSSTKRNTFSPNAITNPGPADYHPNEPVEKGMRQLFPRRHYLAISAPAVPPPPDLPLPGPGAYNIRDFKPIEKKYMSSAVFVSCTSRWTGDGSDQEIPGPTSYNPAAPNKQSFLYNYEKKWV